MAKTMTIQDLRNMVDGHNGEDRISTLPDELIHYIFSFLDAEVAVKTCVLSKRWVNLWTTLPYLDFHIFHYPSVDWNKFISQFLLKRNQDSDTTRVRVIADHYNLSMTSQIIDYAIRHNVKHLHLRSHYYLADSNYNKYQKLCFPVLETLHLSYFKQPLEYWSMPSLTILHLVGDLKHYSDKTLSFERFYYLKELNLRCNIDDMNDVTIKSPNLECLAISWMNNNYGSHSMCKFAISVPKLLSFKLRGDCTPVVTVEGGFPCLKEVDFDLYCRKESLDKKLTEILDCLFFEFRGIKFLTLSRGMIQVLMKYSGGCLSPFGNLKTVHLQGYDENNSQVINYLLNSSPSIKIFIEDDRGGIINYNPEVEMLLKSGYHLVKSKNVSRFQVDRAVLHRVIGVSDSGNFSFSIWEGHSVYTKYLMLLRYIKEKQPETFQHFAPQTGSICTVGLHTLCNSIKALSELDSFPALTITYFRTLFTDLEIWGFNTAWLVNILNNIRGTPTDLLNEL